MKSRIIKMIGRIIRMAACFGLNGCTTIVAGKDASACGKVLLGHNEDNGVTASELYMVPEPSPYLWLETPGEKFCDFYLNSRGVSVTNNFAAPAIADIEKIRAKGHIKGEGMDYALAASVAAKAENSRHGVEIFCGLIDEYGYNAGGRTYVIADHESAWVICAAAGRNYCARRVPDGEVAVIPNSFIRMEPDTNGGENDDYITSPDLEENAASYGLYNDRGIPFRFDMVFGACGHGALNERGHDIRQWSGQRFYLGHEPYEEDLPFSVKPKEKVTLRDMKRMLRDHNEGTIYERGYSPGIPPHFAGNETICRHDTQKSIMIQPMRDNIKGSVLWLALRNPCSSIYVPFFNCMRKIPGAYASFDHEEGAATHFERGNAYYEKNSGQVNRSWKLFTELKVKADSHYADMIRHLSAEVGRFEENTEAALDELIAGNTEPNERNGYMYDIFSEKASEAALKKSGELIKGIH